LRVPTTPQPHLPENKLKISRRCWSLLYAIREGTRLSNQVDLISLVFAMPTAGRRDDILKKVGFNFKDF